MGRRRVPDPPESTRAFMATDYTQLLRGSSICRISTRQVATMSSMRNCRTWPNDEVPTPFVVPMRGDQPDLVSGQGFGSMRYGSFYVTCRQCQINDTVDVCSSTSKLRGA